ncbi:MAG TPA: transposase [Chloroflexia bacterium]|nr:transposase [Chloroflexia bacterium]
MTETLTLTTERVDDIPLLLAQMKQMDLPNLLDSYFPIHGNWQGLDAGWTATIWLAHILSQADHRLSYVQPWAAQHLRTLQQASGQAVRALDFSDDRLAALLRYFSVDEYWAACEAALNRRLLRVYDLPASQVRLDSTTASGYWGVDADGLFQRGHSKDKRPDLPQLKVMLASLDPLPLPLVTHVLPGHAADDPLYGPAIQAVRSSLGRGGLLYVGDSKMAALATRALLQAGGDCYLLPLPEKQLPLDWPSVYLAPVLTGTTPLRTVQRQRADGAVVDIAVGYECSVPLRATHADQALEWPERRLVVRSLGAAKSAEQTLRARLAAAEQALLALNARRRGKQRPADRAALEQATAALVAQYRVAGLLRVQCSEHEQQRRVRSYKGRPERVEQIWDFQLSVERDEGALQQAIARLGWRVYATNRASGELSLEQAVLCYREEYLIEQSFGRLKGAPLSLSPLYLQRDDHATGLVRLLSIAVRVLALVEFVVRRRLGEEGAGLAGLYAGQPQATTSRPTTERLLANFRGVTLTVIQQGSHVLHHVTPLSDLQGRILELLGFPADIYDRLARISMNPP